VSETSGSGAPIHRYQPRSKPFQLAIGDADKLRRIEKHIERHLGKPQSVFHEILSDLVHIDIHVIRPAPDREYYSLVTTGMSDLPMKVPSGYEDYRYAELMISLPPDWPMREEDLKDERNYWPLRWLKTLARFPHEYDTWVGASHTIPTGDPPKPFAANTKLCCMMLIPPMRAGEGFSSLSLPDRYVNFYALVPLYREEMELKLREGSEALAARFENTDGAIAAGCRVNHS
jgi:hypothetical protein